jgi:hypothetical protein
VLGAAVFEAECQAFVLCVEPHKSSVVLDRKGDAVLALKLVELNGPGEQQIT